MDNQVKVLKSIESLLQNIADSTRQNTQYLKAIFDRMNEQSQDVGNKELLSMEYNMEPITLFNGQSPNKESELFRLLTGVYYEEELERMRTNNKKKAARRVSVSLGKVIVEYFDKYVDDQDITVERHTDGLVVISKNNVPLVVIKYMSDLGFCRGEKWYDTIRDIVQISETKYNVDASNVYFIVATLVNGIDKTNVEDTLGESISSNQDFLKDRHKVKEYLDRYINNIDTLMYPHKQVTILATDIHPNVIANELIINENKNEVLDKITEYEWFSSIDDLLSLIHNNLTEE